MNGDDQRLLDAAIKQLSSSGRGNSAVRHLLAWLDDDGIGLDQHNQRAVINLLTLAWKYPGTTRDAMLEAIGE